MKNKKIILISLIIIISLFITTLITFPLLTDKNTNTNTDKTTIKTTIKTTTNEVLEETEETYTIILSINPKVALEIDKNGNIINVYPLNEDAKIFNQEEFAGLNIEKCIEKVIEVADSYLEDKPEISLSITDNNKEEIYLNNIESLFNSKGFKTKKLDLNEKENNEIKEKIKEEKNKRNEEKIITTATTSNNKTNLTTTTSKNSTTMPTTIKKSNTTKAKETTIKTTEITEKTKSNNNYLKELNVGEYKINFAKDKLEYEIIVLYDVESITIKAKKAHDNASLIGIGTKKLNVGENNFKIVVTAESGHTREYIIKVIRRPMINLNDKKVYNYIMGTSTNVYVYPNNPECFNKLPDTIDIPEGDTYDNYCQNKLPESYPIVEGLGYYCLTKPEGEYMSGATNSAFYECYHIVEIANIKEMDERTNAIVMVGNYVHVAGGYGNDPKKIILNEENCEQYNLSCGRW